MAKQTDAVGATGAGAGASPMPSAPRASKGGPARRTAEALARRDVFRRSARWAVGGAVTAWLLGAQTAESAQAGTPSALYCGDFWQSGYYCLGRICHRNPDGRTCHARTTECNRWAGANGQCWNYNGIRYCDWWVYPQGNQRRCYCSQAW